MLTLKELEDQWATDAKIDITEPSKELARVPILHAKYTRFLNESFLESKKLTGQLRKLENLKYDYYNGHLNGSEELRKLGWEPFQYTVGKRGDIPRLIAADDHIIALSLKIEEVSQIAKTSENIIKEISNRNFALSNIVKWEMFTSGG